MKKPLGLKEDVKAAIKNKKKSIQNLEKGEVNGTEYKSVKRMVHMGMHTETSNKEK